MNYIRCKNWSDTLTMFNKCFIQVNVAVVIIMQLFSNNKIKNEYINLLWFITLSQNERKLRYNEKKTMKYGLTYYQTNMFLSMPTWYRAYNYNNYSNVINYSNNMTS